VDSLTQAVLGAALQGTVLGRIQGRRSLAYGAALGTLPDLDVVIRYADPVSSMTYHRGFSHSIFVLTALALVLAWLVAWLGRRHWPDTSCPWPRLFLAFWLVLITHPVLDAFTVYGTQLLWPFAVTPQSWSAVFIVDPVYTLPMLGAVLYAACKGMTARSTAWLLGTVLFGAAYLGAGTAARVVAEHRFEASLQRQGIEVTEVKAMPLAFSSLVWRILAKTADGHYYEGVSSVFDREPPEQLRQSRHLEQAAVLQGTPLHERLRWFTGDWLRYDEIGDQLVVTDLRMGMPGNYTFRFVMARRDAQGAWQPIVPTRAPGGGARSLLRSNVLEQVGRRIFEQRPPLPLARWASQDQAEQGG